MKKSIESFSKHVFTIFGRVNFTQDSKFKGSNIKTVFLVEENTTKVKYAVILKTNNIEVKGNYTHSTLSQIEFKEINKFPKKYIKPLTKNFTAIFLVNKNNCCMISEITMNCIAKDYIFILSEDNINEFYPEGFYITNALYWKEINSEYEQNKINLILNNIWDALN